MTLPHGPLEQLGDNLWRVEGDLPNMPIKRTMVVARMNDGGLVIHNGVLLSDMAQLEALGAPKYLVVPNGWHRLDAAAFKARYPELKVLAPGGARKRVEKVVPVDLSYDEFRGDDSVRFEMLDGLGGAEGVMQVRSSDGVTGVFTDAVFNLPARIPGFWGFVYHDVMGSKPGPRVTRIGKLFMVKDKRAYRAHLERLAEADDLRRVVVGHGAVSHDARAMLREVATTLT